MRNIAVLFCVLAVSACTSPRFNDGQSVAITYPAGLSDKANADAQAMCVEAGKSRAVRVMTTTSGLLPKMTANYRCE